MLLAIVYCWLIALEGGLVNPLQPFLFIDRYACAGHQKPACGKLCLGITFLVYVRWHPLGHTISWFLKVTFS